MSKRCEVTGKRKMYGNNISHSKRHTRMNQEINIKTKRFFISKFNERIKLRLTTRALRTIDKFGTLEDFLRRTPDTELSQILLSLKRRIFS